MKKAISAPFSKGVNFTNWLEFKSADEINADMFTKKDFENVKTLGCDVVRLPIHFERLCDNTPEHIIHDKILGILDNAVSWAAETGIYLILDFHNSTTVDSVTPDDISDILIPVWTQLAGRYKNASEYVVYELMNEPHGIEIPVWNEIILKLFNLVRSIDAKHYIIVGGADWNSFNGMKALPVFEDDKVIYTFHYYDPHTFTHQGASWCHMERVVGIPFPYDPAAMPELPENPTDREKGCFERYPQEGTLEAVVDFFDRYTDFSIERNAPVYCGEFGVFAPFAEREQREEWYRIVTRLLEERGIARSSWDYYGPFGIFDWKRKWEEANGDFHKMFAEPWVFPDDLDKGIVSALGLKTHKLIALTFDDGPTVGITDQILDILEENDSRASFFLIGQQVTPETEYLVKRAHAMGCSIENHTWTHPSMPELTEGEILEEIKKTTDTITRLTGEAPKFFRPPYINVNDKMYDLIDLTFICGKGCEDWVPTVDAEERARMILENACDGAIILVHDMIHNENTVEAVKKIIPILKAEGYEFVNVRDIFDAKPAKAIDHRTMYSEF